MRIPAQLLDATRSRFWRTKVAPLAHIAQPAVDAVDEPASPEPPTSAPLPLQPVSPPVTRQVLPADLLLAALDAALDDAQRTALLTTARVEARDGLTAALAYREMSTLTGRNPPLGALVSALDGAADESARAVLLAASSPALLVELAEHLRAPPPGGDMERQYMDMMAALA